VEGEARPLARYIAQNPADPEHWVYSSYPGLIGTRDPYMFVDPTPVLELFGTLEAFREFVGTEVRSETVRS
jgi:hypothetical protein